MNTIIKILLMVFLVGIISIPTNIKANDNQQDTEISFDQLNKKWVLHSENNGVFIYIKKVNCDNTMNGVYEEIILLKFVNTTTIDMKINWELELWYDNECYTCNQYDEYKYSTILIGDELVEGKCKVKENDNMKIFSKFLKYDDVPQLTKIKLLNISVNPMR